MRSFSETKYNVNAYHLLALNELSDGKGRKMVKTSLILEAVSRVPYFEPIEEIENELEFKLAEEKANTLLANPTIQIFPHPVGNQSVIVITIPNYISNGQFTIFDLQGKALMSYALQQSTSHIIISNEMLITDLYLGIISSDNIIMESLKFVVNE